MNVLTRSAVGRGRKEGLPQEGSSGLPVPLGKATCDETAEAPSSLPKKHLQFHVPHPQKETVRLSSTVMQFLK